MQDFIQPVRGCLYAENQFISLKDFIYTPLLSDYQSCLAVHDNAVHLCYPKNAHEAGETKNRLTARKILQDCPKAGIFILKEKLIREGPPPLTRESLLVNFQVDENNSNLFPHENTYEIYELEKLEIIKASNMNTLPSLAYYTDAQNNLPQELLKFATPVLSHQSARMNFELYQVTENELVLDTCKNLSKHSYLLADGHHRLAGSKRLAKSIGSPVNHLVQIVNNHYSPPVLDSFTLMIDTLIPINFEKIKSAFNVKKVTNLPNIRNENIIDLITPNGLFELSSKTQTSHQSTNDFLSHFYHDELIGKVFELTDEELNKQTRCFHLGNWNDINELVFAGSHVGLRPPRIPLEEIIQKASKGQLFPEKSTRFLPKVTCGILLGKVDIQA